MQYSLSKSYRITSVFAVSSLLIRVIETCLLLRNPFIGASILGYETIGLFSDMLPVALMVALFALVSGRFPRAHRILEYIALVLFLGYAMLITGLTSYFVRLLYPLDKVVFSFSLREIYNITAGSSGNIYMELIPFAVVTVVTVAGFFMFAEPKTEKRARALTYSVAGAAVLSLCAALFTSRISSKVYYFATFNKGYMLARYNDGVADDFAYDEKDLGAQFAQYQENHPEHRFISREYPLLHEEDYSNDVLRNYFDSIKGKPNIVFIIVESLGRAYSGPGARNGSCTPFLDSLAGHGLYWENQFATAERTFEIFPSSLGALPFGDEGFTRIPNMPNHLSLIRLLHHNGYFTSFMHAADFRIYFDNWWRFMMTQNVDTILDQPSFPACKGFSTKNGEPDEILFSHAFETLRAMKDKPFCSILLTTSTHEPYAIPRQKEYEARFLEYMNANKAITPRQKAVMTNELARYTSVYYTDQQIKSFVESFKKNGMLDNTIFVVFGDHSVYNLDPHNQIQQYHVPLLIYSPLVKKPATFKGPNSHWDITPTLLCLLKNASKLDLPAYTHWLGNRLDTSSHPSGNFQVPFISVSRVCKDYLCGDKYLSGKNVYATDFYTMQKLDNEDLREAMTKKLTNYKFINTYVCRNNRLLPDSTYDRFCNKRLLLKKMDVGLLWNYKPTQEFYEFENSIFTDKTIRNYNATLIFDVKCNETELYEIPRMVVSTRDVRTNKDVTYQIALFKRSDWKNLEKGTWQTVSISQGTNMLANTYDSLEVKVYLWNHNKIPAEYRNIRFEFTAEKAMQR